MWKCFNFFSWIWFSFVFVDPSIQGGNQPLSDPAHALGNDPFGSNLSMMRPQGQRPGLPNQVNINTNMQAHTTYKDCATS